MWHSFSGCWRIENRTVTFDQSQNIGYVFAIDLATSLSNRRG
jgi:hypothetical protein